MHELVEGLRNGKRLARLDRDVRPFQHANDLERVERVSARGLMHLRKERTRKHDPEMLLHDPVQSRYLHRADLDVRAPLAGKRATKLGQQRAVET